MVTKTLTMFIQAGHETTATSICYGLWELARHPDIQDKLRAETQLFQGVPTYDDLNGPRFAYLDAVCKESYVQFCIGGRPLIISPACASTTSQVKQSARQLVTMSSPSGSRFARRMVLILTASQSRKDRRYSSLGRPSTVSNVYGGRMPMSGDLIAGLIRKSCLPCHL